MTATFSHDVSLTAATTGLYEFKRQSLVSTYGTYNWYVTTSGTGSAGNYAQSGDVVTSASVLANTGAWWVMRGKGYIDGGTTYYQQLCWQTDGAGNVRLKRSARAGFTGGSPSASRVPSATDERVVWGGGTDASPTYAALWPTSAAWYQARYDEATDSIWALAYPSGGAAPTALFVLFCLSQARDSVGLLVDPDPYAVYVGTGSSCALETRLASEQHGPLGTLAYGDATEAWVRLPAAVRCVRDVSGNLQPVLPAHLAASPFYADPTYAQETIRLMRRQEVAGTSTGANEGGDLNVTGDKGEELYVKMSGRNFDIPTVIAGLSQANSLPTGSALLGVGHLVLPWELGLSVRDGAY